MSHPSPAALRPAPDQPLPAPGWTRSPLLRAIAFFAILLLGLQAANDFVTAESTPLWLSTLVPVVLSVAGYLLVCTILEGRGRPHELAPRRIGGLAAGFALGGGVCLVVFGLCWVMGWQQVLGIRPDAPLLGPVLALGLAVGIIEEIIFRGVLFRTVELGLGTWGAVLASAVVFGMAHLANPDATMTGAVAIALEAGVALGLLYAWSRSLWLVIGVHAGWNALLHPVLGSALSGALPAGDGLVVSRPSGPELLSGGAFGLEASLVSVLVWLAVSAWVALRLRRDGTVVAPWWVRRRAETY
ncbi:type II CAAX endopeptidase family protein [Luteococcus peritonei]|uniref:Type II CAAX endopeptidase family protein n=1 Tax=Luteococcus peritonei TaxID=88874 RepID=A0ABW4RWR4_9ACTN